MSKKLAIFVVLIAALAAVGVAIVLHNKQNENMTDNIDPFYEPLVTITGEGGDDVAEVTPEPVISQTVTPNEPTINDVKGESHGLYPLLSGKHEKIWDDYESIPIEIVALGKDVEKASFKIIWSKSHMYVQVTVYDDSPDVKGKSYDVQDSVEIFLNEDGKKNATLVNGDAHYIVNRENVKSKGFGATEKMESVTYEIVKDKKSVGYVVEMAIPFQTTRPNKNDEMGFDIQINNAINGNLVSIRRWASNYLYTYQNFKAVGTVVYK